MENDLKSVEELKRARELILKEIDKVIVGQDAILDEFLIALFSRGHCLLVGVPGLAKTLMVQTIAKTLGLDFKRIQFTPDLMPSDITGTDILQENMETRRREFIFLKGPIFSNIILADEINRTPPKTQAALLEAMQEYNVTASGKTYKLAQPFFVLATQNPIEQEGTYPLPEAQLDRFMFNIMINYPKEDEEIKIAQVTTSLYEADIKVVLNGEQILYLQELVKKVPIAPYVVKYAVKIVRASRPNEPDAPKFIKDWVSWGAGPRASQYIVLAAKARAIMHGRYSVSCEDIIKVAASVLRHRIITNFNAEADGITSINIIERLFEEIKKPVEEK
ncbi:MAG: AAA family ATPase [Candidatus Firestonebacteria bacterium]|nr:AAA family ATPase [Candidatus Firestonebacteria bacterium]